MLLAAHRQTASKAFYLTLNTLLFFSFIRIFLDRCLRNTDDDIDCDMAEVQVSKDDDTDLESFERDEQRMEEEAAQVKIIFIS